MTTHVGVEKKEREFLAQCVGDAYMILHLLPGVSRGASISTPQRYRRIEHHG
jgi:hypothetical protein